MQYLYIFVIYVVLLSLFASYRLLKDEYYNPFQKSIQLLIIWFLPLLGSVVVAYFNAEEKRELKGIYKKLSWLSRLGAALFCIKLYSKREMYCIDNGYDMGYCGSPYYETNLVETGFGDLGGGDA
jgi:hypothetical protein